MSVQEDLDGKEIIRNCTFFSGLDESAISVLVQDSVFKFYKARQVILSENDPASENGLFIVASGSVDISLNSEEGKTVVVNILNKYEPVNTLSFLDGSNVTANVIAQTDVSLLLLRKASIDMVFEDSRYRHLRHIINYLCAIIRRNHDYFKIFNFNDDTTKVCKVFDQYKDQNNTLRLSTERLSELSGVSIRHVNNILKDMKRRGFIEKKHIEIKIINPEAINMALGNSMP